MYLEVNAFIYIQSDDVVANIMKSYSAVRLLFIFFLLSFVVTGSLAAVPSTMAASGGVSLKIGDWWSVKGTWHNTATSFGDDYGSYFKDGQYVERFTNR